MTRLSIAMCWFLLSAFIGSVGGADDGCGKADLAQQLGPIRNQHRTEWCYGFVTADLLTNFTAGKVRASAFDSSWTILHSGLFKSVENSNNAQMLDLEDLAITKRNYDQEISGKPPEKRGGGSVYYSLSLYNAHVGVCSEDQLPAEKSLVFHDSEEFLQSEIARLSRSQKFSSPQEIQVVGENSTCSQDSELGHALSAPVYNEITILRKKMNEVAAQKVGDAIERQCSPRHPLTHLYPTTVSYSDDATHEQMLKIVSNNLDHGKISAIKIDGCQLQSAGANSLVSNVLPDCIHFVSIIGRRFDPLTRQCRFKVRNSWGPDCSQYAKRFAAKCDGGYLFLTKDDLLRIKMDEVTFLQ